jgi:hypothetical protein
MKNNLSGLLALIDLAIPFSTPAPVPRDIIITFAIGFSSF